MTVNSVLFDALGENDICCGRGRGYINHTVSLQSRDGGGGRLTAIFVARINRASSNRMMKSMSFFQGNKEFKRIVQSNLGAYIKASTKGEKVQIVKWIVSELHQNGARFVKIDETTGKWYDIGLVKSHEKTGHAIRDFIKARSQEQNQPSNKIQKKKRSTPRAAAIKANKAKNEDTKVVLPLPYSVASCDDETEATVMYSISDSSTSLSERDDDSSADSSSTFSMVINGDSCKGTPCVVGSDAAVLVEPVGTNYWEEVDEDALKVNEFSALLLTTEEMEQDVPTGVLGSSKSKQNTNQSIPSFDVEPIDVPVPSAAALNHVFETCQSNNFSAPDSTVLSFCSARSVFPLGCIGWETI